MTESDPKDGKRRMSADDFMAEARALTIEGMRQRAESRRPSALDLMKDMLQQRAAASVPAGDSIEQSLERMRALLGDNAAPAREPSPAAPVESPPPPVKPARLSLDEAMRVAVAEREAAKQASAAAVAEHEAREAKLSTLPPDVANRARELMGLPRVSNAPKPLVIPKTLTQSRDVRTLPRVSNAPKPIKPVRGISAELPRVESISPGVPAPTASDSPPIKTRPEPASTPEQPEAQPSSASAPVSAPPEPLQNAGQPDAQDSTSASTEAVSAPAVKVSTAGAVVTVHKLKSKAHPLDGVIAEARRRAVGDNWQAVWNTFCGMAESSVRPEPLRGYSPGDGVMYRDESPEGNAFFNKEAFRGYWRRNCK